MMPLKRPLEELGLKPIVISTGQQRELSRQAFSSWGASPDVDLDVMTHNQSLLGLTARLLSAVGEAIERYAPDAVLVHGDTTTAFATSVAAFYQKIPLGHVEAGLRTYNLEAPWPEEMNRRLIDPLCRWCFAPTELSRNNLLAERVHETAIFVTGNTGIDALIQTRDRLLAADTCLHALSGRLGLEGAFADEFLRGDPARRLIVVTGHRRESFGRGFESICSAIRALVDADPRVGVVYPVHLNPNVQQPVRRLLGNHPRIQLIAPVGYEEFILLMNASYLLLTDSGGVQEEAPSLGKPVLVMRSTTERPEGVHAGTSTLVGVDSPKIVEAAMLLLSDREEYARRSNLANPYGDGFSGRRIAQIIHDSLR